MRRSVFIGAGIVLWGLLSAGSPAQAGTLDYVIEIKNHVPANYSLEIPVQYPGALTIEADWDCSRILTFKLSSPDSRAIRVRRSGPSPQKLELAVKDTDLEAGTYYRLDISSLPAGGEGQGRLRIHVPDSPQAIRQKELAALPPEPELPEPEWWAVPATLPCRQSQGAGRPVQGGGGVPEQGDDLPPGNGAGPVPLANGAAGTPGRAPQPVRQGRNPARRGDHPVLPQDCEHRYERWRN